MNRVGTRISKKYGLPAVYAGGHPVEGREVLDRRRGSAGRQDGWRVEVQRQDVQLGVRVDLLHTHGAETLHREAVVAGDPRVQRLDAHAGDRPRRSGQEAAWRAIECISERALVELPHVGGSEADLLAEMPR
jgi:hypothetical protein